MEALRPDFRIACTGTPVENRLLDLWNLFDTVQPGLLGSAKEFSKKFESNAKFSQQESSLRDLKTQLLYEKPHAFLVRRLKSDVLELPKKHEHKISCAMSSIEIEKHQELAFDIGANAKTKSKLDFLHQFARLYQHPLLLEGNTDESSVEILKTSSSKLRKVLEVLRDIQAKGEKTIVFARHKDVQRMLARVFTAEFGKPVRVINGDTPRATSLRKAGMETRKRSLEEFAKTDGFQVIVLSPFVAGVGLTIVDESCDPLRAMVESSS